MHEEKTKSFAVSKRMVYDSYLKVSDKNGGAGIDKETIDQFNENLSGNLYKVWNRMASGSYFPPAVRTVLIPKKQGGTRPLGIPTVGDRIAQGVVKDYLEPILNHYFMRVHLVIARAEAHMMRWHNAMVIAYGKGGWLI